MVPYAAPRAAPRKPEIERGEPLPQDMVSILEELRSLIGADRVLSDRDSLERYGCDWTRVYAPSPSAVALPGSLEDVPW